MMKLTDVQQKSQTEKLTNKKEGLFRMSFETPLKKGFEVKDMNTNHVKELHNFLKETVYKGLTISQVDQLFLRKRGLSDAPKVFHNDEALLHYGKDQKQFRIFGYYNDKGYFVICRIDGDHKTHT